VGDFWRSPAKNQCAFDHSATSPTFCPELSPSGRFLALGLQKTSALIGHSATSPAFARHPAQRRSSVGNSRKPPAVQVSKGGKRANCHMGVLKNACAAIPHPLHPPHSWTLRVVGRG